MIKFGVAGNSNSFYSEGNTTTVQAAKWCKNRGVDVFEYSFGRGINLSEKSCIELKNAFESEGIELTVHAPYYINFANSDPEMIAKSILYVLNSLKKLTQLGGDRVVVHPATQGKAERNEAFSRAKDNLALLANEVVHYNGQNFKICLETMGKLAQIGDAEETADFCSIAPFFYPCIDFGHLNARTFGSFKTIDDYLNVFDVFLNKLPFEKVCHTHIHFSKIMYGTKGEIKHLTFEDSTFGPEFEPLCEAMIKLGLDPIVICESDGTQAEDAVAMKKIYLSRI